MAGSGGSSPLVTTSRLSSPGVTFPCGGSGLPSHRSALGLTATPETISVAQGRPNANRLASATWLPLELGGRGQPHLNHGTGSVGGGLTCVCLGRRAQETEAANNPLSIFGIRGQHRPNWWPQLLVGKCPQLPKPQAGTQGRKPPPRQLAADPSTEPGGTDPECQGLCGWGDRVYPWVYLHKSPGPPDARDQLTFPS